MAKRGGFPGGMGMPGNMNNLMKQAQRMQRQMEEGQKELEVKEFSAKSGGGAVEAVVNGKKELVKLTISEEAVDPEDVEMLQDMIVAAVNEAMKQADEASQELMGKMTGGLGRRLPVLIWIFTAAISTNSLTSFRGFPELEVNLRSVWRFT